MLRVGKQKKNIELNPKIQYITDRKTYKHPILFV